MVVSKYWRNDFTSNLNRLHMATRIEKIYGKVPKIVYLNDIMPSNTSSISKKSSIYLCPQEVLVTTTLGSNVDCIYSLTSLKYS